MEQYERSVVSMRSQFVQLLDASLSDDFDFQPLLHVLVARLTAESRFRYNPGGYQAADLEIGIPQDDGVRWFAPEADEVSRLVLPKTKLEISYAKSEEKEYIWWVAQCLLHGLPFPTTAIDAKAILRQALLASSLKRPKELKSIRKRLREKQELDNTGIAEKVSLADDNNRKENPSELQFTTNKKPPLYQALGTLEPGLVSQVKMKSRERKLRSPGPSPSPSNHREPNIVVNEGSDQTGNQCARPSKLQTMDNRKSASKKKSKKQDANADLLPGPREPGETVPSGMKKKVKKQSMKTTKGDNKGGDNGTSHLQSKTAREREAPDAREAAGTTRQEKKKKKVKKGDGTTVEAKVAAPTHAAAKDQKGIPVSAPNTTSKQDSTKNKKGHVTELPNVKTTLSSKPSNKKESVRKAKTKKEKKKGKHTKNEKQAVDQLAAAVPANEGDHSIADNEEAFPTTTKRSPTWSGSTTLTTPEVEDLYAAVLRQASEERSMQHQADSQIIAELSADQNVMPEPNQAAASAWTAYRDNNPSSSVSPPATKAVKTSWSSAYTVGETSYTISEAPMSLAAQARSRGTSEPTTRAGDYPPGFSEVVLPPTISSEPLHDPVMTQKSKQEKRPHEAAFEGPTSESMDFSDVRPKKKRGQVVKAMDDRHEAITSSVAKFVTDDNVVYVPNLAEGQKPHFPLFAALMKHASQYNYEGSVSSIHSLINQVDHPHVKMRGAEGAFGESRPISTMTRHSLSKRAEMKERIKG
ncbi:hypothetical protein PV05_06684 [Exophiala xenobiotica]|uniref:Uncharacterized protein n=1 Tax=Exophiala xenobiotica TaxID=348802 RepID=A0A0D2EFU2_9EURO|nr:uncharacterized protein PV05_06684 [Exophiala xenobiotica]KIW54318.1 hypothetical protein PV05_06684 [Exophiala xenobiotica]